MFPQTAEIEVVAQLQRSTRFNELTV